ncbi:MAG: hypothetical protein CMM93_01185 [Rickettsiales bacterium]|nr:hypothetical protein [Rickettsiales bacterium]
MDKYVEHCINGNLAAVKSLPLQFANHEEIDYAFTWTCYNGHLETADYLISLLNRNKYEFYFRKGNQFCIIKHLDFKCDQDRSLEIEYFDDFKIYYSCDDCVGECIENYQAYRLRFNKKSARSYPTS